MHSKKIYLYVRRESGQRSHCQRKRRIEGKCYYKWRAFNKAHNEFLRHYRIRLLETFAIPATEDDELARFLITEAAIAAKKKRERSEANA